MLYRAGEPPDQASTWILDEVWSLRHNGMMDIYICPSLLVKHCCYRSNITRISKSPCFPQDISSDSAPPPSQFYRDMHLMCPWLDVKKCIFLVIMLRNVGQGVSIGNEVLRGRGAQVTLQTNKAEEISPENVVSFDQHTALSTRILNPGSVKTESSIDSTWDVTEGLRGINLQDGNLCRKKSEKRTGLIYADHKGLGLQTPKKEVQSNVNNGSILHPHKIAITDIGDSTPPGADGDPQTANQQAHPPPVRLSSKAPPFRTSSTNRARRKRKPRPKKPFAHNSRVFPYHEDQQKPVGYQDNHFTHLPSVAPTVLTSYYHWPYPAYPNYIPYGYVEASDVLWPPVYLLNQFLHPVPNSSSLDDSFDPKELFNNFEIESYDPRTGNWVQHPRYRYVICLIRLLFSKNLYLNKHLIPSFDVMLDFI